MQRVMVYLLSICFGLSLLAYSSFAAEGQQKKKVLKGVASRSTFHSWHTYRSEDVTLFPIKINGKFGYIDRNGKVIIVPQYDHGDDLSMGMIRIKVGDKYGYLNSSGEMIIEPKYFRALSFYDELTRASLKKTESSDKVYGFINKKGDMVISEKYKFPASYSEGFIGNFYGNKWGYDDKTGKMVIHPQFDWSNEFRGDLAKVWIGSKVGYIDKTGKYVWEPSD